MLKKCLMLVLMLFVALPTSALTITETGSQVTVTYDEPTINEDGSLLTDLDKCTIYFDISGAISTYDVLATSLNGGGTITQDIIITKQPGVLLDVPFWATCWDNASNPNESVPSATVIKRFDWLAPGAPR